MRVASRALRVGIGVCALVAVAFAPRIEAQRAAPSVAPNYELASAWTTQKVSKLVFDTSVTPRWLETSDRFWYSYQTRDGRRFYLVDPLKRTKGPLFDHAKVAAALTTITRTPYDAQHLPFTQLRARYTGPELCGLLAHAAGVAERPLPCAPGELVAGFAWSRVRSRDRVARWDLERGLVFDESELAG